MPRYDFSLLRDPNVSRLWFSTGASAMGDWAFYTAVSYGVFVASNSVLATSTVFLAQTIPRVLFGSFAGVLVDRMNRKRLLVLSDIIRAVIILFVFWIPVRQVGWLDGVVVAETAVTMVFGPARMALLPALVEEGRLVSANALVRVAYTVSQVLGPVVGAFLLVRTGLPGVVIFDVATYGVSAVALGTLAVPAVAAEAESAHRWWADWREGARTVATRPWLRGIALAMFLVLVADGALSPAFVAYMRDILHQTAVAYGAFRSVAAVGGFIGGLLLVGNAQRKASHRAIPWGMTASGLLTALMFVLHTVGTSLLLYGASAFANVIWGINLGSFLQTYIEPQVLGRASAFMGSLQGLGMLVGLVALDAVETGARLLAILIASGLLMAVAGGVAYLAVRARPRAASGQTVSAQAP
jgi:DHA3 family macrolide efflux protein-like MFS transporter